MRTAIYTRVSTEEQAKEGYSIEAQENRLREFASSQGWSVVDLYVDDGYSAKNLDRPAMKRLIRDIKKGNIDVVLVYKLDRLVRSVLNLHELLQLFEKYGVKFRSATEMFDTTTAMGRFFITLVGAMAEWERENLAERVLVGMETKAEKGERNGGTAPYGYKKDADGKLVKDPVEGKILERIFTMYKNNTGVQSIIQKLNAEGIPFRKNRRKKDQGKLVKHYDGTLQPNNRTKWYYSALYYILRNPVYCGKIRWGEQGDKLGEAIVVDGEHEPYMSVEEFENLQNTRSSRGNGSLKLHTNFVFSGILRCGRCGFGLVGTSQEGVNGVRRRWYRCTGARNYGTCDFPHVKEEDIEAMFLSEWETQIGSLHSPEEEQEDDTAAERLNQINAELAEIKDRKKQWIIAFGKKAITVEELQELNAEDNQLEATLREEIEAIEAKQAQKEYKWSADVLNSTMKDIREVWPRIEDVEAKKMFLQELFESITINVEKAKPRARKVSISVLSYVPRINDTDD